MSSFKYVFLVSIILFFSGCKIFNKTKSNSFSPKEKVAETSLLIDAVKEKNIGNYEVAINKFNLLISKNANNHVAHYQLSLLYKNDSKYNIALDYAKKAIALSPKNEWYKLNLVELYEATKQYPLAAKIREGLIAATPENTDYYFDLVVDYIYSDRWEDAINTYSRVEKQIGITEEVSLAKHRLWLHLKNPENAALEIQKLVQTFPAEDRYPLMLGDLYLKTNQYSKAKQQFDLSLSMNNFNTYLSLADYYKLTKNNDSSIYFLSKAFATPAINIDLKIPVMLSFYNLLEKNPSMSNQANQLLDSMQVAHTADPKFWSIKGDFALLENNPQKAQFAFQEVLKFDQSKYVIWEELLKIVTNNRNFDTALLYVNKAIELFPSQPFLFYIKGLSSFMLADYQNAISSLETGKNLVLEPNQMYLEMFIYLGESYHKINNNDRSDAAFEKVLEYDPKNSYVLNNYAYYLALRNEKLAIAEKMGQQLIEINPEDANYLDTYAWVLFKSEKYAQALPIIEKAIALGGENKAAVLEHFGDILWKNGKTELALEKWEKALKIEPNGNARLKEKIFFKSYDKQ